MNGRIFRSSVRGPRGLIQESSTRRGNDPRSVRARHPPRRESGNLINISCEVSNPGRVTSCRCAAVAQATSLDALFQQVRGKFGHYPNRFGRLLHHLLYKKTPGSQKGSGCSGAAKS